MADAAGTARHPAGREQGNESHAGPRDCGHRGDDPTSRQHVARSGRRNDEGRADRRCDGSHRRAVEVSHRCSGYGGCTMTTQPSRRRTFRYRYRLVAAMLLVSLPLLIVLAIFLTNSASTSLTSTAQGKGLSVARAVTLRL